MLAFTAATRSIATHPTWSGLLTTPDAAASSSLADLIERGRNHCLCTGDEPFLQALLNLAGEPTEHSFGTYFDQLNAIEQSSIVEALRASTSRPQRGVVPGEPVDYELVRAPIVRARLSAEKTLAPGADPRGRLVAGYREGLDAEELWERSRGPWRVEPVKMLRARLLVITSPENVVVAVGAIDTISHQDRKVVVDGRLLVGHPLIGSSDPLPTSSPNPIAGGTIDVLAPVA